MLLGSCLCYVTRDQRSRVSKVKRKEKKSQQEEESMFCLLTQTKAKSFKLELTKKHDEGQFARIIKFTNQVKAICRKATTLNDTVHS